MPSDHVVALGNAWATGAGRWSDNKRLALANDPLNLLAVDPSANRQKGDGDAATWLPPYKAYRCSYVARQVAVKAKYHLWVTRAEHDGIATDEDVMGFFERLPNSDKQLVKIGGLAHTAPLGINRHRFWHALHAFLTMPERRPAPA